MNRFAVTHASNRTRFRWVAAWLCLALALPSLSFAAPYFAGGEPAVAMAESMNDCDDGSCLDHAHCSGVFQGIQIPLATLFTWPGDRTERVAMRPTPVHIPTTHLDGIFRPPRITHA